MLTVAAPCWTDNEMKTLVARLAGNRRILLWGEMGVGKSTLAVELLKKYYRLTGHGQLLELDPGSPPFGIPGTICRGWWGREGLQFGDAQALCTLNGGRFRLPLVLAAGRLASLADQADSKGPLLIDPPGVVRGVGGAELLTDLADTPDNRRKVIGLAQSAHTLFCETPFIAADGDKAEKIQHLTTLAAIGIARDARVERLVPFHFSKRYERDPQVVYDELLAAAGPVRILGNFGGRHAGSSRREADGTGQSRPS